MSWGIAETASEIEKIKSESVDYLIWLNACGIIEWNTYDYVSDFYAKLLMKAYKQGEKDARPEQCEDAISRQAAIEEIKKCHPHCEILDDYHISAVDIEYRLFKLPSVTPKRKTGKWIVHYECPKCGEITKDFTEYCPFCNADMRGSQNEPNKQTD